MVFNSLPFALFFVFSVSLFFMLPPRHRWLFLLASSYYFYMSWKIEYGLILAGSTLVTYMGGRQMAQCNRSRHKKLILAACLLVNLGALFFFKYFNFFSRSLSDALHAWDMTATMPTFELLLPVGISFYIFQSTGYVVDVYRGRTQPETHLGVYALFVAFWPQILSGPIGRANRLLPQLKASPAFSYSLAVEGLRLMLWGLFKKVVIADFLGIYVSRVYDHLGDHQGFPLIIAAAFYTVQIYCDFSGYTDMARGAAKVMGVDLMENFQRPYFAKSFRDFWQRWHISLSTWFRDYVYIPLGGRRVARWRWYHNLMITFLLSGLWHGANWTFVVWGALHGGFIVLEYVTGGFQQRIADRLCADRASVLNKAIQVGITLVLVGLAWIFFRADSIADAWYVICHMVFLDLAQLGISVVGSASFGLSLFLIVILIGVDLKERRIRLYAALNRWPLWLRWAAYTTAGWAVAIATVFGVRQEYIYFQF
jgi:D-alanyl-lipoteichoic acid acyltransferase DltB (MBOAT superfamily)